MGLEEGGGWNGNWGWEESVGMLGSAGLEERMVGVEVRGCILELGLGAETERVPGGEARQRRGCIQWSAGPPRTCTSRPSATPAVTMATQHMKPVTHQCDKYTSYRFAQCDNLGLVASVIRTN
jgi:hypothetical protein